MKKSLIYSFIVVFLLSAPAFGQTSPSQKDEVSKPEVKKIEVVLTKKQKIEADLRDTAQKLSLAIDRTQKLFDTLSKGGKDTLLAQEELNNAKSSLKDAVSAIDQYAGILPVATDEQGEKIKITIIKEPLKKSQELLKNTKLGIVESIKILKEGLSPKESEE